MSRSRPIIMIALALGLACHKKSSPPTPPVGSGAAVAGSAAVPVCKEQLRGQCTGLQCGTGGNSAYTNVFPVNGLDAGGACNPDQIQLLPGTLSGGECGSGASLTFDADHHALVGMNGDRKVCEKKHLEGATFQVRSGQRSNPTVTLAISHVEDFQEEHNQYEGYRINYGSDTVCNYLAAARALNDLGFGSGSGSDCPGGSATGSAEPYADLVVALPGPIYDQTTGAVTGSGSGFFNLACAGDALAKTAFYQINETSEITTAALRMITARYGGSNKPFTIRGIPITVEEDEADMRSPLVPEAKWDNQGKALCVSTPRLMTLPGAPGILPSCLQPTGSGSDWTAQLRSELGVGSCDSGFGSGSGVLFRTWTGGDGTAVLLHRHK